MEDRKVLLSVKDLDVKFHVRGRELTAIRNVSLDIYENESIAIVGESGSGKSVTAYSIMQILAETGKIISGEVKTVAKILQSGTINRCRSSVEKNVPLSFRIR